MRVCQPAELFSALIEVCETTIPPYVIIIDAICLAVHPVVCMNITRANEISLYNSHLESRGSDGAENAFACPVVNREFFSADAIHLLFALRKNCFYSVRGRRLRSQKLRIVRKFHVGRVLRVWIYPRIAEQYTFQGRSNDCGVEYRP